MELPALRTYVQCPICLGTVIVLFCSKIPLVGCDSSKHYSALYLICVDRHLGVLKKKKEKNKSNCKCSTHCQWRKLKCLLSGDS